MPNESPPRGSGPGNPNQTSSSPQPRSTDSTEQTIRIEAKPDRGAGTAPRQTGRQAEGPTADEGDFAAAPLRSGPRARLPWPSRDEAPSNPRSQQTPPPRDAYSIARAAEPGTPLQGRVTDPGPTSDSAPTQLYRPGRTSDASDRQDEARPRVEAGTPTPRAPATSNVTDDPVVGWLVVVEGPGKGRSLELGTGANSIGRNSTQKIALDFGDAEIHRERHAQLVFDPRSNRFFLQGSPDARNLTYLDNDLVLTPVELKGGETIIVGRTHLRFIPLCGPRFSWS
jgi:hypothetical protein